MAKVKGHKLVELTSAGEKRGENSWSYTCSCGAVEGTSTKQETQREYALHLARYRKLEPECLGCSRESKPVKAKWPVSEPKFCSLTCAADHALSENWQRTWCGDCREWHEQTRCPNIGE